MEDKQYQFFTDKSVQITELIDLVVSVGWGAENDYDASDFQRSLAAYPFIVYARNLRGRLVGYLSAFSDGAFSTFIGELFVHPGVQGTGIGTELLRRVAQRYPGVPIYAAPFDEARDFFLKRGYRIPKRPMTILSKRNAVAD